MSRLGTPQKLKGTNGPGPRPTSPSNSMAVAGIAPCFQDCWLLLCLPGLVQLGTLWRGEMPGLASGAQHLWMQFKSKHDQEFTSPVSALVWFPSRLTSSL